MNLIELLGGYDEARKFAAVLSEKLTEKQKNNVVFMDAFNELNNELLEYRRANHIFEVGDKVVSTLDGDEDWKNAVCEILAFHKKMAITTGFSCAIHHCDYRHATDEEIEVGHRL